MYFVYLTVLFIADGRKSEMKLTPKPQAQKKTSTPVSVSLTSLHGSFKKAVSLYHKQLNFFGSHK